MRRYVYTQAFLCNTISKPSNLEFISMSIANREKYSSGFGIENHTHSKVVFQSLIVVYSLFLSVFGSWKQKWQSIW